MDDDNLPTTAMKENLISSFIEFTSLSREEAEIFLETHQWDLDAAVSAFNENKVAASSAGEPNVPNPSDQQLTESQTPSSNLLIDNLVSSTSPTSHDSPSPLQLPSQSPSQNQTIQNAGNIRLHDSNSDGEEMSETHVITIWKNGFTIDNGTLKTFEDPNDAKFIKRLIRTKPPYDLTPYFRVELIKRYDETYPESPEPIQPLLGVGSTLAGSGSVSTDPPAPMTSIQLRLADGTRVISRFNTHQTVRDVRDFVDATRPSGSRDYQLLIMGFPPKPLTDLDQTIELAGISNCVVIQTYIKSVL